MIQFNYIPRFGAAVTTFVGMEEVPPPITTSPLSNKKTYSNEIGHYKFMHKLSVVCFLFSTGYSLD